MLADRKKEELEQIFFLHLKFSTAPMVVKARVNLIPFLTRPLLMVTTCFLKHKLALAKIIQLTTIKGITSLIDCTSQAHMPLK